MCVKQMQCVYQSSHLTRVRLQDITLVRDRIIKWVLTLVLYIALLLYAGEIKACPRCGALIVKMDDGSCNHMTCTVCAAEFCWLCMQEISDIHYLR